MVKTAENISGPLCSQVAALPWRREADGTISVLLVTSRTNAKWMLPKGWPMAGKTDAEAALEEAKEEAGIDGIVSATPLGSYHFLKLFNDGSSKPAQAIIYSVHVEHQHTKWREKGQRQRRWFSLLQASKVAFEPDLARFLKGLADGRVVLF